MSRHPEAMLKLDAYGLDAICDDIIDGKSYAQICADVGVGKASLVTWIALDSERSARTREAMKQSAQGEDDKAEAVLLNKDIEPMRARELASHYRWRARVRNPHDYGEKLELNATHTTVNLSEEEIIRRRAEIARKLDGATLPPPASSSEG